VKPLEPLTRREGAALAFILVVALALRVAVILSARADILFDHPVVDEESYVRLARGLVAGASLDPKVWWQPPGLVYALAVVFRLAGPGLLAPRLVQAAVSTASCGLAFHVARRLFTTPIALATAAICAVHGVLVFESGELLPPTWILAADLIAVALLLRAGDVRTPASALSAGVAFGVSAVFAPTVLPFAALSAAWLRRPVLAAALVVGVLVPIAPVALGNWNRGHEIVAVSSNGGANFYIGNNEAYDATLALRPGRHWEELMDEPGRAGASLPGAASSYFARKGLAFYGAHPVAATALLLRKVFLYFDGEEIPRDTDIYAERAASPLLGVLVGRGVLFFPDGLLIPLALAGAVVLWRDRRALFVPYAFAATMAIVTATFFVTARYRVSALPFFAMFASAAVARARASRVVAAVFLVSVVPLNLPTRELSTSFGAEVELYRGLAFLRERHDPRTASLHFRLATTIDPTDARSWFELGNALDVVHDPTAVDAWQHAAALDPWDSRARRRIASALTQRGDVEGAIAALRANLDAHARDDAHYAPDHLNLAFLLAQEHEWGGAIDELRAAARSDPSYFGAHVAGFTRAVRDTPGMDEPRFQSALAGLTRDAASPRDPSAVAP
jgi:hypothetical protein